METSVCNNGEPAGSIEPAPDISPLLHTLGSIQSMEDSYKCLNISTYPWHVENNPCSAVVRCSGSSSTFQTRCVDSSSTWFVSVHILCSHMASLSIQINWRSISSLSSACLLKLVLLIAVVVCSVGTNILADIADVNLDGTEAEAFRHLSA